MHPAAVDRVQFSVVAERHRHHVRPAVLAGRRKPAEALPGEILDLLIGKRAHATSQQREAQLQVNRRSRPEPAVRESGAAILQLRSPGAELPSLAGVQLSRRAGRLRARAVPLSLAPHLERGSRSSGGIRWRRTRRPATSGRSGRRRSMSSSCGPALDDPAVVEHDDPVGEAGRLQPVRDHDGGAPAGDRAHRRGDPRLGAEVEVGGGLVQQQDRRVDEFGAGEREQLPLSGRQRRAALAQLVPVAARQPRRSSRARRPRGRRPRPRRRRRPAGRRRCCRARCR